MKRHSVHLTAPQEESLKAISKELDLPVAALIRMAIAKLLAAHKPGQGKEKSSG